MIVAVLLLGVAVAVLVTTLRHTSHPGCRYSDQDHHDSPRGD